MDRASTSDCFRYPFAPLRGFRKSAGALFSRFAARFSLSESCGAFLLARP